MIIGGYTLHLYCDHCDRAQWLIQECNQTFATACFVVDGDNKQHTLRKARRSGWRINEGADSAMCPLCVKEKS